MTAIKLCGLTRLEDIIAVNELKPEYIGFVFWDKSTRNVTAEQARTLKKELDSNIKAVGVFVDADIEFVQMLFREQIIDIAQLHGSEDNAYIETLKSQGIPTIKAFKVTDENSVERAKESPADYIIFDPGKGSGMTFNYSFIQNVKRPFFLAGGLTPDNVKEAIKATAPFAVDVSSGIETDRVKDVYKMRQFVKAVRG